MKINVKVKRKKLALLGGKKTVLQKGPHFPWPIITTDAERVVLRQLHESVSIYDRSGIFKDFEDEFASLHKRRYALVTSSGTEAIHSMFVGANLKAGDEVLCPVYTFYASVTPLLFTGARPVLCDSDQYGNLDPKELKNKLTIKTRAVVVTHMWGIPCDMDPIVDFCNKRGLLLFEDASHAPGATYKGKITGTFGTAAAWSLQGQKIITGGEGGILLTDDAELYYKALLFGQYNKRCKQEIPVDHKLYKYSVTGMGLKLRANTLSMALAKEQFSHLKDWLRQKRAFAHYLDEALENVPGIIRPRPDYECEPSWYAYTFRIDSQKIGGVTAEKFYQALKAEGCLEADRPNSTCPLNLLPLFQTPGDLFPNYAGQFSYRPGDFPVAEKFFSQALKIPVWVHRQDGHLLEAYVRAIIKVAANYHELLL